MIDANLNLTIEALVAACKGNVKMLPSFVVHDNDVWPSSRTVRVDSQGRLHMRRATFLRQVAKNLPVKAGLWTRVDAQEFFLDLKPHHLQGSEEADGGNKRLAARAMAKADSKGRLEGDDGYGESAARNNGQQDVAADVAEAKAAGTSRSIRTTVFSGSGTGKR